MSDNPDGDIVNIGPSNYVVKTRGENVEVTRAVDQDIVPEIEPPGIKETVEEVRIEVDSKPPRFEETIEEPIIKVVNKTIKIVEETRIENDIETIETIHLEPNTELNLDLTEWYKGGEKLEGKSTGRIQCLGIFQIAVLSLLLATLWILN